MPIGSFSLEDLSLNLASWHNAPWFIFTGDRAFVKACLHSGGNESTSRRARDWFPFWCVAWPHLCLKVCLYLKKVFGLG